MRTSNLTTEFNMVSMSNNLKYFLLFALSVFLVQNLNAQTEEVEEEVPLKSEKMPVFNGGEAAMNIFVYSNIKYPELARKQNLSGLVIVSFVVETDGSVGALEIKRDIGGGCGEEALRVAQLMNNMWTPGYQDGEAVRVQYNLPVRFKLDDGGQKMGLFKRLFSN